MLELLSLIITVGGIVLGGAVLADLVDLRL